MNKSKLAVFALVVSFAIISDLAACCWRNRCCWRPYRRYSDRVVYYVD